MREKLLKDLDPAWCDDGVLMFDCPSCSKGCFLGVPTKTPLRPGGYVWKWNGETDFDKVTLDPSINYDLPGSTCKFHGWIKNGKVTW